MRNPSTPRRSFVQLVPGTPREPIPDLSVRRLEGRRMGREVQGGPPREVHCKIQEAGGPLGRGPGRGRGRSPTRTAREQKRWSQEFQNSRAPKINLSLLSLSSFYFSCCQLAFLNSNDSTGSAKREGNSAAAGVGLLCSCSRRRPEPARTLFPKHPA